jgi:hypothetical protein
LPWTTTATTAALQPPQRAVLLNHFLLLLFLLLLEAAAAAVREVGGARAAPTTMRATAGSPIRWAEWAICRHHSLFVLTFVPSSISLFLSFSLQRVFLTFCFIPFPLSLQGAADSEARFAELERSRDGFATIAKFYGEGMIQ